MKSLSITGPYKTELLQGKDVSSPVINVAGDLFINLIHRRTPLDVLEKGLQSFIF